ncbi:MAG: Gfo/Idh/MocA family oxidoreductase [Ilumatobacteraceae bacterium]|nr:Gfo/Idh/MocA family oxidoreductase [Ilumatobacteraceae bacterium]
MTVRWGFIGAGYVASRAMRPAVHAANGAILHAVASRDAKRSAELEPVVVHQSYRALIDDPNVDAVYISLTNVQHKEWVVAALEAGKHVLCEKPLAMNAEEVRTMQAVAERHQRLLVEAVWTRWQPRMKRMAEVVRRGDLGEPSSISTAFTFQGDLAGNYRSQPEMGGGALLDVGCYQAHLWLMLLGESVDFSIDDVVTVTGPTGIDLTTSAEVTLNQSVRADAVCSFDMAPQQRITVNGTDVSMRTGDGEAFTLWKSDATLIIGDTVEKFAPDDAFALMVKDVSAAIRGESNKIFPALSSLRVAEILDSIRTF